MNNILKIERALVFAKEVGLNDEQVKELMALILEIPYFKLNLNPQPITSIVPWAPNTTPIWPNITSTTDGCPGIILQQPSDGTLKDFANGLCGSVDLPVSPPIISNFTFCACSQPGQPHNDSCKATGINEGRPL